MTNCDAPVVNRIRVPDPEIKKIKEILNIDPRSPLVLFSFDKFGNISFYTSNEEFNNSPFALENQKFLNIVPASFITTQGSHNVTVAVAGESTTSSMPF